MQSAPSPTFLARNEFLVRRLHSLSGLIPVGAYMCVHLITNASVLDSPAKFQGAVNQIHGLGVVLPLVEWVFIFTPILFHAILGVVIIRGGLPNTGSYSHSGNVRYTLQRATGMIAFLFIMWHVFHMHGWFHWEAWLQSVAEPLGGANFRAFNAASSAAAAMQKSLVIPLLYGVGTLSCVFHLANGIWTMGITWGVWTSPAAQRRATVACVIFGVALAGVGLSAIGGFSTLDVDKAEQIEKTIFEQRISSGAIEDNEATQHKRSAPRRESVSSVPNQE